MTPKTSTQRTQAHAASQKEKGLVKISPSYWVHQTRRQEALDAIKQTLSAPKWRKEKK